MATTADSSALEQSGDANGSSSGAALAAGLAAVVALAVLSLSVLAMRWRARLRAGEHGGWGSRASVKDVAGVSVGTTSTTPSFAEVNSVHESKVESVRYV